MPVEYRHCRSASVKHVGNKSLVVITEINWQRGKARILSQDY